MLLIFSIFISRISHIPILLSDQSYFPKFLGTHLYLGIPRVAGSLGFFEDGGRARGYLSV